MPQKYLCNNKTEEARKQSFKQNLEPLIKLYCIIRLLEKNSDKKCHLQATWIAHESCTLKPR